MLIPLTHESDDCQQSPGRQSCAQQSSLLYILKRPRSPRLQMRIKASPKETEPARTHSPARRALPLGRAITIRPRNKERKTAERTRRWYLEIFLPHAKRYRIPTDPEIWYCRMRGT